MPRCEGCDEEFLEQDLNADDLCPECEDVLDEEEDDIDEDADEDEDE